MARHTPDHAQRTRSAGAAEFVLAALCASAAPPGDDVFWPHVLWLARLQRVLPRLVNSIATSPACSATLKHNVLAMHRAEAARRLARDIELAAVHQHLAQRGIDALLLNSSAFCAAGYDRPERRTLEEVSEFVVRREQRDAAAAVLRDRGYDLDAPVGDRVVSVTKSTVTLATTMRALRPLEASAAETMVAQWFDSAQAVSIAGASIRTLAVQDWLLYRTVAMTRSIRGFTAEFALDVMSLVGALSARDCGAFLSTVTALGVRTRVLAVLGVSYALFHAQMPDWLASELVRESSARRLVALASAGRAAMMLRAPKRIVDAPPASIGAYVPTPDAIVVEMLNLANVDARDVVYDLGAGDGRVVMRAAERGAMAIGIECDAELVRRAVDAARQRELNVRFDVGDAWAAPLDGASVVFFYAAPGAVDGMLRRLFRDLPAGARIVAHNALSAVFPPDDVSLVVPQRLDWSFVSLWIVRDKASTIPQRLSAPSPHSV